MIVRLLRTGPTDEQAARHLCSSLPGAGRRTGSRVMQ